MIKSVLGIGSGRCGTTSLASFLNAQKTITCTHERYDQRSMWYREYPLAKQQLKSILEPKEGPIVGDVGQSYLKFIQDILDEYDTVKIICLKRDREKTINSFLKWSAARYPKWLFLQNSPTTCVVGGKLMHLTNLGLLAEWCLRRVDEQSVRVDLGNYYDDYYEHCEILEKNNGGKFKIFPTETLNTKTGMREILDFIDLAEKDMIFKKVRANTIDNCVLGKYENGG